jgi:hypothetical protein
MPRFLERVVRQTARRRHKRIAAIVEMQPGGGTAADDARDEDRWEGFVRRVMMAQRGQQKVGKGGEPTFAGSLAEALAATSEVTERERLELVAKGRAMWQVVLREQELALEEEREKLIREGRDPSEAKPRDWRRPLSSKRKERSRGVKDRQKAVDKERDAVPGQVTADDKERKGASERP